MKKGKWTPEITNNLNNILKRMYAERDYERVRELRNKGKNQKEALKIIMKLKIRKG